MLASVADEPGSGRTDAELLRVADADAFGQFYERHVEGVLRFLYVRSADAEIAADLASETFVVAYLKRGRFRASADSARPWLLGIARRVLLRSLRKGALEDRARKRLAFETPALDVASQRRIEELADLAPLRRQLKEALGGLSEESARAVYLRVGLEMTYATLANELGCSEGAARVRVMRGLARLRETMEGVPQ